MYTLGGFLLLLLLILILDLLQRPNRPSLRLLLYALLAALSLWTLYYSAFALVALNLFVLPWLWFRSRRLLLPWLLAQAGALLLYLPWLPTALRQAFDPPVPSWRQAHPHPPACRHCRARGEHGAPVWPSCRPRTLAAAGGSGHRCRPGGLPLSRSQPRRPLATPGDPAAGDLRLWSHPPHLACLPTP